MTEDVATAEQRAWLEAQFSGLTTELEVLSPSEWAEAKRYLPAANTSIPGFYRFDVTPYLREIVDCLGPDSPIREVVLMKGVQIGGTVGVLENAIGYCIDHVKTAPVMLVTADAELAKLRMESYITPMLQASGLLHLIKSTDEKNARKSGKTDKKIEWEGGGFLIPFGAQNANKLRSFSIQYLLRDEIDGWPEVVGKDGDPIKLSADRCAGYESSRKIFDLSTPTIKGQSKVEQRFKQGDQRYYFVCCLKCGFPQVLRWRRELDGVISGIVWEHKANGSPDSVRYLCENCQHPHTNDDKTRLLNPSNGAHWKPTATPASPDIRSYHLSALYSPPGMQTWPVSVGKWIEAWDVERARPRDLGALQVFYNNVLGEPFELRGEKLRFEQVSAHRRDYRFGEVPNKWAVEHCGSPILVLTCSVDVHKDHLPVAVWGWCRDRRAVLLDYWRLGEVFDDEGRSKGFEGDTSQLDDPKTWGALRTLIEEKVYTADDGSEYKIPVTLVDSGFLSDQVYSFCAEYQSGVFPCKGREESAKAPMNRGFAEFETPLGLRGYGIIVDGYKDRWSAALRHGWDGHGIQPAGHFNASYQISDKQLRELTVEVKREKIEKSTGKRVGFEWHRPGGAANELWDLLIYGNTALELIAWNMQVVEAELEAVNWTDFWAACQAPLKPGSKQRLFYNGA
jgi:phage terminase large subunit GpA-like protein